MSAAGVTARGRAAAERIMVDTCIIERETGSTVDPDTGAEVPVFDPVYEGKCRVQHRNFGLEWANAGQQRVDMASSEVQLPSAALGIHVNDRATVLTSFDPDMAGRIYRIKAPRTHTHATKQTFTIEEWVA